MTSQLLLSVFLIAHAVSALIYAPCYGNNENIQGELSIFAMVDDAELIDVPHKKTLLTLLFTKDIVFRQQFAPGLAAQL
jgi:hypothetical protein